MRTSLHFPSPLVSPFFRKYLVELSFTACTYGYSPLVCSVIRPTTLVWPKLSVYVLTPSVLTPPKPGNTALLWALLPLKVRLSASANRLLAGHCSLYQASNLRFMSKIQQRLPLFSLEPRVDRSI